MTTARHSQHSRNPFHAGGRFRGFTGSLPLQPARLLAPLYGSDWDTSPATGDFYFQAFNGSVFLPVAGYNYNSDWTPLLEGLSPAGKLASLHGHFRPVDDVRGMSASLIGHLVSSAFRLSTTAVSMSLTGSCFSSESAPGPLYRAFLVKKFVRSESPFLRPHGQATP